MRLNLNSLDVDANAVVEFQKELNKFDRVGNGVNAYFDAMLERVESAKAATRVSPNADMSKLKELASIETQLQEMDIALHGDKTLGKHQFEIEPSILDRIGLAAWSSWSNQNTSTNIQNEDYKIAKEELKNVIADLEKMNTTLMPIEKALNVSGAPYLNSELPKL